MNMRKRENIHRGKKIRIAALKLSGHIVLNASCQLQSIEENAKCNYNCKFPIKTEMGLLYNFAKQLPKLNEQEVGIFVELL